MPIESNPYETGDVVELLVGGPDMVVLDVCADCGNVDVAWFNGEELETATLPFEVLVPVTVH